MEKIVEKMCHAPAECFRIEKRGFVEEGMYGDMVLIDPSKTWQIAKNNIYYKCGWSPLEGKEVRGKIDSTYVNGHKVYDGNGNFIQGCGHRLMFDRT